MTHRPELLSAMLDGELTTDEAIWVRTHLDECGPCRSELEDLASARAAVRGLPVLDLPQGLEPPPAVIGGSWRTRTGVAITSVAAAAAVGVVTLAALGMSHDPTPVDVLAAEDILAATASLDVVADGSEAAQVLTAASSADYRAQQTVACVDDHTRVESAATVTRIGGVTVMAEPLARLRVLTDGSVSTGTQAGPIHTVTVTGAAPRVDGYVVSSVELDPERSRPTEIVTFSREGTERVRVWVDAESGAIVQRELLGDGGDVACVTVLTDFEPVPASMQASIPFDIRAEVTEKVYAETATELPAELGGLGLVAAYPVDGGVVGVYGDGVMLVAVMRLEGGAPTVTEGSRLPAALWEADGLSWAVLGAVPSDVLDAVAADLPAPDGPNPIADGWRRLFG